MGALQSWHGPKNAFNTRRRLLIFVVPFVVSFGCKQMSKTS